MNRVKVEKNKDYTVISNVFLRDKSLSLKAKGVLAMIMALSDDWEFSIGGFAKLTKEGESAIYSAIKELKSLGYCEEEKIRDENKRIIGNEYTFFEKTNAKSVDNQLNGENLDLAFQNQGNQGQLNTNKNKVTKEIKEEKEDKSSSKNVNTKDILDCYDISNIPQGYVDVVRAWCQYKKERKEKYKSQSSFDTMVKRLVKLSNGNPRIAALVVEQSIANNYAGLFAIKSSNSSELPLGFKLEGDVREKMKELPQQSW